MFLDNNACCPIFGAVTKSLKHAYHFNSGGYEQMDLFHVYARKQNQEENVLTPINCD